MSALVYDLQSVIEQAAGKPIHLEPTDTFMIAGPSLKISGQIELYAHGATFQHAERQKTKSAPMVSGPNVTGLIDGLTIIGQKDPEQGYVASREGHAGFWFGAAIDLTLSNCQVLHIAGDFAYFGAIRTGTAKAGTLTHHLCQRVTLDNFIGIDAGRYCIGALGVGIPGLTIKANCIFKGWKSRTRIDRSYERLQDAGCRGERPRSYMGEETMIGFRHQCSLVRADVRYYSKHRRWLGLARALWATIFRLHHYELCQECGRRYPFMWWSPAPLWAELMPAYHGLLCPQCFDKKTDAAGIRVLWTPMVVTRDGVPNSNHWQDETRDRLLVGEPDPDYFPGDKVRQPQPPWARLKPLVAPDVESPYPAENRVGA